MRIFREIKWFFQRITKGYSDVDLWNLDDHLAKIILPRLKAYKKMNRAGVPGPLCLPNQTDDDFKKAQKQWEDILDSMILAFETIVKDDFETCEEYKKNQIIIEKGLADFSKYFQSLWD
jgi:hypothetical protein